MMQVPTPVLSLMDWLCATELEHAPELIQDFHKSYPTKPGLLTSLHWTLNNKHFIFIYSKLIFRTLLQSPLHFVF